MYPNETQSPDDLAAQTQKTRAEIEDTLETLENRLSVDQVIEQIGQALIPARDGTVRFAQNLGSAVRENPVPAALVGIGLGWLLLAGRRTEAGPASVNRVENGGEAGYGTDRRDPSRPVYGTSVNDEAHESEGSWTDDRVQKARDWARKRSEEVGEKARATSDAAYRRGSDTVHRAGTQVSNRRAEVGNFVQRRPILTGVAIAGVGAAIAAAVFARTDRGKATISRASEAVKDGSQRVKETVRSTTANVSEAATDAASKAGERLKEATEKTARGGEKIRETAERSGAADTPHSEQKAGSEGGTPHP